jgi:putative selenium metabolism protein SsnA
MLIKNGKLITWDGQNQILEGQAIAIKDGKITDIGPQDKLINEFNTDDVVDANGQYVMPGNICAHTHFYGAFSRGMGIPGNPPKDFPEILDKLWWPLDRSLSLEDVRLSALICMVDAIRHGTTTLFDHHASAGAIEGSLEEIAQAVEESGLRVSLCYEVSDRDGEKKSLAGIQENSRFINYVKKEQPLGGRLSAMFGMHASLTLSEETLEKCRNSVPDDYGFHVHAAEHPVDEYDSVARYGLRVIDRFNKHGILGPRSVIGHATHVDAREIAILSETGTWVAHQPRSNMNNGVGVSAVEDMLRSGIKVVMGNDGFSNAMWDEWRTAYLVQKVWHRDPQRMNGMDVVEIAVKNNSSLASSMFNNSVIGKLVVGAKADIIFVDYFPYTPMNTGNLPWHILFGFRDSMVTTTIVDGIVLMRNRQLLGLDEDEINRKAQRFAPLAWERYQKQFV